DRAARRAAKKNKHRLQRTRARRGPRLKARERLHPGSIVVIIAQSSPFAHGAARLGSRSFKAALLLLVAAALAACGGASSSPAPRPSANRAPIADAGADLTARVGDTVRLDGSRSSDADGDALSYIWRIVARPAGSEAALEES